MFEKFQYQALNLMDEICTVEVTVDYEKMVVHLFDFSGAIYPIYDYASQSFVINDEFEKMLHVLSNKYLMRKRDQVNERFRFEDFKWIFYTPQKPIRKLVGSTKSIVLINQKNEASSLLQTYFEKIL
jgi:hypothetical protein